MRKLTGLLAVTVLSVVVLGGFALFAARASATIILETASLGQTGEPGGTSVDAEQYLAARFTLTQTTQITAVGGHLFEGEPGGVFAAIIPLSSPTALPSFLPSDIGSSAVAGVAFTAPFPSDDVLIPLSVVLSPGSYALVFGSNAFGATGGGGMPEDNSPIGTPSFFLGQTSTWTDTDLSFLRFVVEGTVVPEPGTSMLVMSGLAVLAARKPRSRSYGGGPSRPLGVSQRIAGLVMLGRTKRD